MFTQAAPGTFRQHDAHTALGISVWHVISERPIDMDPVSGALVPNLLERWEVSDPAGTELVLRLRDGLHIHDRAPWNGRDFDAEDLAFNLKRAAGLTAASEGVAPALFQRASLLSNLVSAEVVDPRTVRVKLSAPNSALFNGLADARMLMMPREVVSIGFSDPLRLAGPGPFQVAEWRTDVSMRFTRSDRYFRPNEPYFDEFASIVIPDAAAQEAAFISKQTQLFPVLAQAQGVRIKQSRPDALLYEWPDTSWQHVRFATNAPGLRDPRVRRALALAVDYAALGQGAFGDGWEYQGPLNPAFPEAWAPDRVHQSPGHDPDIAAKARDRQTAAQLLDAAGFARGAGLTVGLSYLGTNDPARENVTRLQQQWATSFAAGTFTPRPIADNAQLTRVQTAGDFEALATVATAAPDATLELTAHHRTGGSRNYGGFSEPEADSLLDRALRTVDGPTRAGLLDTFQARFLEDWLPMVVLYAPACAEPAGGECRRVRGDCRAVVRPWVSCPWRTLVLHRISRE